MKTLVDTNVLVDIIPLSFGFGTFSPDGGPPRSPAAIDNVGLEGEGAWHLGESVELAAALGVALPTGQGGEIPDDLAGAPASSVNPESYGGHPPFAGVDPANSLGGGTPP